MFGYLCLFFTISLVCGTPTYLEEAPIQLDVNVDTFGIKENTFELLKRLYKKLKEAALKGSEFLEKVLEDQDVQDILASLGRLNRRIVEKIIEECRKLAQKIDEITSENTDESYGIVDIIENSEMLKNLIRKLKAAYEKGSAELKKVLNDKDVQDLLKSMNSITRRMAEEVIKRFIELAEKIDAILDNDDETSFDLKTDAKEGLRTLLKKLIDGLKKGKAGIDRVLSDPDVQAILKHLSSMYLRVAEKLIEKFKELAQKLEDFANENPEPQTYLNKRDLSGDSWELLKRLYSILYKAFDKGRDYFYKVLEDEDVKGILDHLGPLTRRMAEATINKLKDLLEKIDESTNYGLDEFGIMDDSTKYLKQLYRILKDAFIKGSDYLEHVLEDPDVKSILDHLGPLARKIAEGTIEKFKELAKAIDEAASN